jgi:hypothetical protein
VPDRRVCGTTPAASNTLARTHSSLLTLFCTHARTAQIIRTPRPSTSPSSAAARDGEIAPRRVRRLTAGEVISFDSLVSRFATSDLRLAGARRLVEAAGVGAADSTRSGESLTELRRLQ